MWRNEVRCRLYTLESLLKTKSTANKPIMVKSRNTYTHQKNPLLIQKKAGKHEERTKTDRTHRKQRARRRLRTWSYINCLTLCLKVELIRVDKRKKARLNDIPPARIRQPMTLSNVPGVHQSIGYPLPCAWEMTGQGKKGPEKSSLHSGLRTCAPIKKLPCQGKNKCRKSELQILPFW